MAPALCQDKYAPNYQPTLLNAPQKESLNDGTEEG